MPLLHKVFQGKVIMHSAEVHVCIGFKPRTVLWYNETDLTNEAAIAVWSYERTSASDPTSIAKVLVGVIHGTVNFAVLAATLIQRYDGGDTPPTTADESYQDGEGNFLDGDNGDAPEGFIMSTGCAGDQDVLRFWAIG